MRKDKKMYVQYPQVVSKTVAVFPMLTWVKREYEKRSKMANL